MGRGVARYRCFVVVCKLGGTDAHTLVVVEHKVNLIYFSKLRVFNREIINIDTVIIRILSFVIL